MSHIKRYDQLKVDDINHAKPEKQGQSYFGPMSFGETLSPIYIQTPKLKCLTNLSEMKDKKAPYIDVEIPTSRLDFYDFFVSLDDKNIKKTVNMSKDWFNKELPLEAIDDMYKRTTKPFKKNTSPILRFRIPCIKNEIKCGIYNQKRVFIDPDEVKEGNEIILILHIRGLKVLKTYFYCDCYVSQIKVFQDNETRYNIINEYSILDSEDDEFEDIFDEEIVNSANDIIERKNKEEEQAKLEEQKKLEEKKILAEQMELIQKEIEDKEKKRKEIEKLLNE